MLKIKEDINLERLEKEFGFEDFGGFWYRKVIYDDLDTISIGVNKEDRMIQLSWLSDENSCGYTHDIDILFDIIQAGLVEKVEKEDD